LTTSLAGSKMMNNETRLKITKIYLWIAAVFLLFWSPLSHWFYADFYHYTIFGFENYDDAFVKVIGTTAFIPTLLLFFSALNPIKNRDSVKTLIIAGFLMSATYIYLINTQGFPVLEYFNAVLMLVMALSLLLIYPWNLKRSGG
jgi:hypothetical protein